MAKKTLAEATKEIFDKSVKTGYRDAPQAIHDPNEDDTGEAIVHPFDKGKVYDKDVKKDKSAPVKNADEGDLNKKPKLSKVSEEDDDFDVSDLVNEDGEIDEDMLNEISADTLRSYIKKNIENQAELGRKRGKMGLGAGRPSAKKNEKLAALAHKETYRSLGLKSAVERMGKKSGPRYEDMEVDELESYLYDEDGTLDEDTLNEISADTLRSYIRSNAVSRHELAQDRAKLTRNAGRPTNKLAKKLGDIDRKASNRQSGLDNALSRVGKKPGRRPNYEDMEVDELESYLYDEDGNLNEEVLNELSADTLKSYVTKNADQRVNNERVLKQMRAEKSSKGDIGKMTKKIVNRRFGMATALSKFGKKSGPKSVNEAYDDENDKVSMDGQNVDNNTHSNNNNNGEENVEGTKKLSAKGSKAQIIINIGENIELTNNELDPLFEGQDDLSEDYKEKVRAVFEAAVGVRVNTIAENLIEEANELFESEIEQIEEELSESVEDFLKLVARDWLIENQVALEQNLKSEIIEEFIVGLKGLFNEHWIDIPEEKLDVIEELSSKNSELEESLDREISEKIETSKYIKELEARVAFNEIINEHELTVSQVDNISALAENIQFDDVNEYGKKLNYIIETYVSSEKKQPSKTSKVINEELITDAKEEVIINDKDVKAIARALSQNSKTSK